MYLIIRPETVVFPTPPLPANAMVNAMGHKAPVEKFMETQPKTRASNSQVSFTRHILNFS
jgi:hypothetical protein